MTPQEHQEKAGRIERSLSKCVPEQFEIIIEGAMLAGSHWFNAALHRMELNPPDNDMMHAQYLSAADRLKLSLIQPEMLRALDEIESFRQAYVRGNVQGGVAAGRRSLELLGIIRVAALASIPFRPKKALTI